MGAFKGLVDSLDPKEIEYDVVTGISVGAVNAFGYALYPKGQEAEASDFMMNFWEDLKQENVFQSWDTGYYDSIF